MSDAAEGPVPGRGAGGSHPAEGGGGGGGGGGGEDLYITRETDVRAWRRRYNAWLDGQARAGNTGQILEENTGQILEEILVKSSWALTLLESIGQTLVKSSKHWSNRANTGQIEQDGQIEQTLVKLSKHWSNRASTGPIEQALVKSCGA